MKQFLASLILVPAWLYCAAIAALTYSWVMLMDLGHTFAGFVVLFLWVVLIRNGRKAFSKPPLTPDQDHVVIVPLISKGSLPK